MVHWATDENFNNDILRGLLRRKPDLEVVRIQDVGLSGASDPEVLAWCANEKRILLTHDVSTVTAFAIARVERAESMPGVIEVSRLVPVGVAIDDILLLTEASNDNEWEGRVIYLPLR